MKTLSFLGEEVRNFKNISYNIFYVVNSSLFVWWGVGGRKRMFYFTDQWIFVFIAETDSKLHQDIQYKYTLTNNVYSSQVNVNISKM